MRDLGTDDRVEQRTSKMRGRARAGRAVLHLCAVPLQERSELRNGAGGKVFAHLKHHRLFGKQRDWREVIDGVVAPLLVDCLIVRMRARGAEQDRIAVRRGIYDTVHTDDAAGACGVLDHYLLAKNFTHAHSNNTAHYIERASRCKRHHQGDRPRWISLGSGVPRHGWQRSSAGELQKSATWKFHDVRPR